MKRVILALACVFLISGYAFAGMNEVSVLDSGAKPDGTTDCTKAFQAALDLAGKTGGTVLVPAGKYRFDGSLTIPEGVALKGSWQGPHLPLVDKGSTLLVYGGRGDEKAAPFITMRANTLVEGFTIHYPEQRIADVRPYPWTIRRNGFRCSMINLAIANTYNGIDCGTIASGGQHLRNIDMAALRRGVYIDRSFDIGRIENVHIHPVSWVYGDEKGEKLDRRLWEYLLNNLEGFIIGKCDWEYMIDCFTIFTKVGFRFIEMELAPGQERGVAEQGNIVITQSGADLCLLGVLVEKVQDHAGISFENCQFMSGIEIAKTNAGPVKFANCGFWGVSRSGRVIKNEGSGTVMLSASHFSAWDDRRFRPNYVWDPKVPFIEMLGGSLTMTGCMFKDFGNIPAAHVFLGEAVRSASITGNSAEESDFRITNRSKGEVYVGGNVGVKGSKK